ncbi:MAG: hypothetical protein IJV93_10940 [Lentisphaeria bacterium]|nr:hypothetical protein [Lentisphaeria bacterium]
MPPPKKEKEEISIMIDYGEDKQTYGVPKITVGPVSQTLTALYIGVFLLSFFMPNFAANHLAPINADLPLRFWTLLTGVFVFPDSAGVYTQVPAGFWVIITFFHIFLVLRPLEEKTSLAQLIPFLLIFMLCPALAVWGISPKSPDPGATWGYWFAATASWAFWKFRTLNLKFGEKRFPCKWFYLILTLIPVIFSAIKQNWTGAAIYLASALLALLWGVMDEHKNGKTLSAANAENIK